MRRERVFFEILSGFILLCIIGFPYASYAETDITDKIQLNKGRLLYDRLTGENYFDVSLTNISSEVLLTPIKVVIDSVSPATVTVSNADGVTEDGKPYFVYETTSCVFQPSETSALKQWRFANPTVVRFTYTPRVIGTVSTPEAALERATSALNANDVPAFMATLPSYEQESMKTKLGQLGPDAPDVMQTLSGIIGNATVVEETETYRKMQGSINLPDGTIQDVFFDMILENGIWMLGGL